MKTVLMWGHNIIFALTVCEIKKKSLNYCQYSLLFETLSISETDRKILNLRGLYQKRDLTVLQSKFIDDSDGQCRMYKV